MNRKECPFCDNKETEFIQFGGEELDITKTGAGEIKDGLLELRFCNNCYSEIENVLNVEQQQAERKEKYESP